MDFYYNFLQFHFTRKNSILAKFIQNLYQDFTIFEYQAFLNHFARDVTFQKCPIPIAAFRQFLFLNSLYRLTTLAHLVEFIFRH